MSDDEIAGDGREETDTTRSLHPSGDIDPGSHPRGPAPERIGPYRLRRKIGEGGMGEVWEAEQVEPIQRTVALKLIKHGLDSRRVITRFESERQALALMDHPGIARIFDAGATAEDRPFFVMEYVPGEPVTTYCDRHRLSTDQRLELFIRVCEAVQHAHQKAVIHRDLKPSNVLVHLQDGKPVPKIIDFGIAKATQQRLTEQTAFTELGQIIGTPEYMSPEQADLAEHDIDTRSDVYSLGVILYELLAGALPLEAKAIRQAGLNEMLRKIREEEPARPSTRVSTLGASSDALAQSRRTDPRALSRRLEGDLDWITLKALSKDRAQRYGSPTELAADITRHVRHEPVVAGPPGAVYRARKFLRRHRIGAIATGLVVLTILFGLAGTVFGLVRARRAESQAKQAEERAREDAATAEQVSEFLVGLFEVSDPSEARGNTITAREILDKGAGKIEEGLADQPRVQARMLGTVGEVYYGLGLNAQASHLLERALEIRRRTLGADDPETLNSIVSMGYLFHRQGRFEEAELYFREALDGRRLVLGDDDPATLNSITSMGILFSSRGKLQEAELYFREALAGYRRVRGDNHIESVKAINNMGYLLQAQGKLQEAEPYFRDALEGSRRLLGDDDPDTLTAISNLGALLLYQGKLQEAGPFLREALERRRRVLGDDHTHTLISITNLGGLLQMQGMLEEAEPYFREGLERSRRVLGDDHLTTLTTVNYLGNLLRAQGKPEAAEQYLLEALEGNRRVLGDDHPRTLTSINSMGNLLSEQGKNEEAEAYLREALDRSRRVLGNDHPSTLSSLYAMGELFSMQGRLEKAEPYYDEALEGRRRVLGDDHRDTLATLESLANLYRRQERDDEAERLERELERFNARAEKD